jgi:hypothetical protein
MRTSSKVAVAIIAGVLIGVVAFVLGRSTAPHAAHRSSTPAIGDYFDGLRVGEAQGRRDGRALQEGIELTPSARHVAQRAFDAGYVAGTNDAFAGYDGGWTLHTPWIVTLEGGSDQIVYRIRERTRVEPGVDYYLCPDGHTLCHRPRR